MRRLPRAFALALVGACVAVPRAWTPPTDPYGPALEKATRFASVYRGMDTVLFVYATAETPAFRQARATRLGELFSLPPGEAEARASDLAAPSPGPSYFLAVHTQDRTLNDLEQERSAWAVRLAGPAGPVAPVRVTRFPSVTSTMKALHPYLDRYWVAYRVTFPPGAESAAGLVLSGPEGRARLDF